MISKQLKISLAALALLMAGYTLLRLGFFIANYSYFSGAGIGDILKAFIFGLRFDLSALLMINGVLLLVYNFPLDKLAENKWFKISLLTVFWAVNILFITINLSDYGYFQVTQRRQMSEILVMFGDIMRMLPSMFADYWYLFIILLLLGAGFVAGTWRVFRNLNRNITYRFILWRELVCFLLLAFLLWPGVKGGFQRKPIRPAHAFFSTNRAVGYLALNSSFTLLKSLFQANLTKYNLLPEKEALAELELMLAQPNEQMIDSQYPFLRRKSISQPPNKLNLVIFIMESWTADYIGAIRGPETVTPFFDSIAPKGMLFKNFIANGQRSVTGIPSVIDSIAGFYTTSRIGKTNSFIESQSEINNYIGLGSILLKNGYTTSFHHGARRGALGFDAHSRMSGFTNYYGREDYIEAANSSAAQDTVWGVWDEEFFRDAMVRMDGFTPPFCSVIFSLTSHEPFQIPPQKEALFSQYTKDSKLQHALRYSDYALEQFFEKARDKSWFKNTVFIITADHTTHSERNNFHSCFNIPLLIYAPGIIKPSANDFIGSQVDILPTVLDILRVSAVHASMGASLVESGPNHYAVVSDGSRYAIFSRQYALLSDLEKDIELYDYKSDKLFTNNLAKTLPDIASRMKKALYAYIQEVSGAIANNKICRDVDVK